MKRNYKILLAIVFLSATLFAFKIKSSNENDPDKDKLLLELLTFVIEKGHYNPAAIDDTFSKGIYKDYIQALDPSSRFHFLSSGCFIQVSAGINRGGEDTGLAPDKKQFRTKQSGPPDLS